MKKSEEERHSALDVIDAFNEADKDLSSIWNILSSDNNLSIKMRSIYRRKVLCILKKLSIKLTNANEKSKQELINTKKNAKRNLYFIIGLLIVTFITLCFNPVASLIPLFISLNISLKLFKNASNDEITITNNIGEIIKLTDSLNILTSNITRRLSIENDLNVGKDKNITEVDLANEIIIKYLEDKELLDMSDNIKDCVIKLLQSDLKTNNSDIEELLDIAYEKNKKETINEKKLVLGDSNEKQF